MGIGVMKRVRLNGKRPAALERERIKALRAMRRNLKPDIGEADPVFRTLVQDLLYAEKLRKRKKPDHEFAEDVLHMLADYCATGENEITRGEEWDLVDGNGQ